MIPTIKYSGNCKTIDIEDQWLAGRGLWKMNRWNTEFEGSENTLILP